MSSTLTISSLAGEAYDWFTRKERGDETITVLKEDAPEWLTDLVREAHGDFLPDEWRYKAIRSALGAIHDNEGEDIDDLGSEWADQNVDTYTYARLHWLASHLSRADYCDDAVSEIGINEDAGIVDRIGFGQYVESREIFASVRQSLEDRLDELEGDES